MNLNRAVDSVASRTRGKQRAGKMSRKLRLVVLGMMGRCPFGGQTWLYLNWLRGLHKLGHEVWYVEDDTVWPYDPERNSVTDDCSYAVRHIAGCMERRACRIPGPFVRPTGAGECYGITSSKLDELYRTCDALLNVVGATDLREEHLARPLPRLRGMRSGHCRATARQR